MALATIRCSPAAPIFDKPGLQQETPVQLVAPCSCGSPCTRVFGRASIWAITPRTSPASGKQNRSMTPLVHLAQTPGGCSEVTSHLFSALLRHWSRRLMAPLPFTRRRFCRLRKKPLVFHWLWPAS